VDSVYLAGSEDVRAASRNIASAAETMQRAASQIDEALARHQMRMDEWLDRFERIMAENARVTREGEA
jgi:hypothetical protein